jgi:hypothetical protein
MLIAADPRSLAVDADLLELCHPPAAAHQVGSSSGRDPVEIRAGAPQCRCQCETGRFLTMAQ